MCECIRFTNIKQMMHATGRQTNDTQIIGVTQTINKTYLLLHGQRLLDCLIK